MSIRVLKPAGLCQWRIKLLSKWFRLCSMVVIQAIWATHSVAYAELVPDNRPFDSRVSVVDYNPLNVVRVTAFYGVSTYIEFDPSESIKEVAVGDDAAWSVVPRGNHLFIKPKEKNADTNLTVLTDKHVYHFSLYVAKRSLKDSTAWRDENLVYGLVFRYPDDEAHKKEKMIADKERSSLQLLIEMERKLEKNKIKSDLASSSKLDREAAGLPDMPSVKLQREDKTKQGFPEDTPDNGIYNFNYWVSGHEMISPTGARDDGRFTYLLFSNSRDMPAVYMEDETGKESLINTHVEGNTIIVHHVVPKLKLRRGDAVACILNKAFDNGTYNDRSGTVSSEVERTVKEVE